MPHCYWSRAGAGVWRLYYGEAVIAEITRDSERKDWRWSFLGMVGYASTLDAAMLAVGRRRREKK